MWICGCPCALVSRQKKIQITVVEIGGILFFVDDNKTIIT